MKRKVSLYIADTKVDLDDDSLILFNYTKDDLSNPTAVKNSYSHKVTLKGTPTNNKLFGDIFRMDRQTLYSEGFAGAFFDPMRKTPFQIFDETSAVLESGYIKLDNVSRNGNDISYTVTLYGGLGSFFYGLTYNGDGTKRTLADLSYLTIDGRRVNTMSVYASSETIKDAWSYLSGGSYDFDYWNIVNFAPCYNGIPEDFDANKALMRGAAVYGNGVVKQTIDGVEYYQKTGTNSNLATFANPHTEWELCDLRWYLQRPVISMRSIIEAICYSGNNGGYVVDLDLSFFNSDNAAYYDAWLTLPMILKDDRNSTECINSLLRATLSPAEYLLSFAKMFGLVFKYDTGTKKVSILSRNTFYQQNSDVVDLSKRINKSETIDITPITAKSKWYQFGNKVIGQFAEEYQKDYGRLYGIQRINTGYEFDVTVTDLTKDIHFKDAVDVMESNRMFAYRSSRYSNKILPVFLLPAYEEVTVQLWGTVTAEDGSTSEQSIDVTMKANATGLEYDNPNNPFGDWLPKVQLHGSENKPEDGSNVLLIYGGMKETPSFNIGQKRYRITDDSQDMVTLNEGVPCWDLTGDGIEITSLPSFRRVLTTEDGSSIIQSYEWGEPFARAVPMIKTGGNTLYDLWWKNYLTDLYNDDTRIMKCKVDLRGLQIGQQLLQRFFWYEGSIWVLNKISNYSMTTYDDVECEFIKVNEVSNYKNGQTEI